MQTYLAADFDKMISDHHPDEVIITTGPDRTHNVYIVRAMELGCNVITEKPSKQEMRPADISDHVLLTMGSPVTIDAPRCKEILKAVERTGQKVRVTFNYR